VSAGDVVGAVAIGFAAGMASGMLGIGGGALFVPGLVFFLGLDQVSAEATSLLAIIPVALVGAWRQLAYGNVNSRDGVLIGLLSPVGVVAGVVLAHALPDRALAIMFAAVQLYFAFTLARTALRHEG
jgi:uncharacterized protein